MKRSSRKKRRTLSCSPWRWTTSTRSTTSSWTVIETKFGSSWSSWEKPQWNGRTEPISRLNIRHNCEEKVGRRSRHYPWTHWQKYRNYRMNEWFTCMNDSRDFQDPESERRWHSHVTSQPTLLPLFRDPGGMLSRALEIPSRKNGPPSIWDTHGKPGNVVANPTASSSAPFPEELNPWSSNFLNTHHTCDEWKPNTSSR